MPNRRRREAPTAEEEARIDAFARQADTLASAAVSEPVAPETAQTSAPRASRTVKVPKDRAYTFRMTEETLIKLREAADAEERSIQWIFDKVLLPALDKRQPN